ncbi:MAG: hypothetical protein P5694_00215 [Limnospira sp. PMC 1286.21]|uniref:hypothetical protein n=1 Tax=unclassified Limnospira TaxID=2642885 RepID=UPI0028E125F0|nr:MULTISPECIES: hypothetical protein [unclassified Limnospira]MDT9191374.1 hypothetical protein [Limnospira sp. PMC 1245.20]MDT9206752.1 hypothetical protein [Limnospira sp. PMC 1252.20]MDT9216954.1 hypothetical protein [Limnospira sp. PMC 1240.20]MDT9232246.1 hypothetical protein [Limnospira sp. PMC 917.15]MDT9272997.1 hypothetical protein [Limnospira sp. PMC 737.11]
MSDWRCSEILNPFSITIAGSTPFHNYHAASVSPPEFKYTQGETQEMTSFVVAAIALNFHAESN